MPQPQEDFVFGFDILKEEPINSSLNQQRNLRAFLKKIYQL